MWTGLWTSVCAHAAELPSEIAQGHCDDLDAPSLVQAIESELPKLALIAANSPLRFGRAHVTATEYLHTTLEPLLALARQGRDKLCAALPKRFELLKLAGAERGHVTAYYNPILRGSRTRHGLFQHPLYRRPDEANSQRTTAEILAGGLNGKGLEIVYLESVGAALNVHIEGSVTVQLAEGGEINLTTDGNNGHPYTNPFKLARRDKVVPADQPAVPGKSKASAFFDAHPEILRTYWAMNPHFVYFKETPLHGTGKFGELITGRSVAVDAEKVPMGAALWLRTEVATAVEGDSVKHAPIARVTLAQDTGAAIRGIGRIDLFVGSGEAARIAAARTSRPGELYLIISKSKPRRKHR